MITAKDKCLAAIHEARRHEILAKLADEPIIQRGHLEMSETFTCIADDYSDKYVDEELPV